MRRSLPGLLLSLALVGACSDTLVPDLNNPSADGLQTLSRPQIETLMQGIMLGSRAGHTAFIRDAEIIGRDMYNLDEADPRWVGELLVDLDPGGFGGRHWLGRYQSVRTAELLIDGVAQSTAISEAERSATLGFAKTMKALDLIRVYESRGPLGLTVEVGATSRDLMPILCEEPALAAIAALLDDAESDLEAGGAAFVGELPQGFAGFDTPATFVEFNRALRAKVAIYQRDFATALAAVNESFIDPAGDLDIGLYYDYSTGAGDVTNALFQDPASTTYRVHPSVADDAPTEGAFVDRRFTEKVTAGTNKTYQGVGSALLFTVYEGLDSPVAIITNEELVLLRAQAYLGLGDPASLTAARADINTIRQRAGGFATTLLLATPEEIEDELLVQKRYSLLFRSPSRWVDMRFYGRLDELPKDLATHAVAPEFPIPTDEELARGGDITCQAS